MPSSCEAESPRACVRVCVRACVRASNVLVLVYAHEHACLRVFICMCLHVHVLARAACMCIMNVVYAHRAISLSNYKGLKSMNSAGADCTDSGSGA